MRNLWVIFLLLGSWCVVAAEEPAAVCRNAYKALVSVESQVQDLDRRARAKKALTKADAAYATALFDKLKPTWAAHKAGLQKLGSDESVRLAQQMVDEQEQWAGGSVDVARAEAKWEESFPDPDRIAAYVAQGHERANTARASYLQHKKELARRLGL